MKTFGVKDDKIKSSMLKKGEMKHMERKMKSSSFRKQSSSIQPVMRDMGAPSSKVSHSKLMSCCC